MERKYHRSASIIGPPPTATSKAKQQYPIPTQPLPLLLLLLFCCWTTATTTTTTTTFPALAFAAAFRGLPRGSPIARSSLTARRSMKRPRSALEASSSSPSKGGDGSNIDNAEAPLYLEEGLFSVRKPLGWTSQDVVGKLRYILESDARARGAPDRRTKRRKPWMKVGHGGTLDPLATGVLVCGVGKGTRQLQKYLVGSKAYQAEVTLGYQTTTLDGDPKGSIVEEKPFDHVTSLAAIDELLQSKFTGKIQQVPPVFSALKRDGKKLYELGRKGQTAEDLQIEAREVTIYDLKLIDYDPSTMGTEEKVPIRKFSIAVECGGGTYIRSLVRDIGIALGTVATMTKLERTKQGRFLPEHCLSYQKSATANNDDDEYKTLEHDEQGRIVIDKKQDCDWTVDAINEAIRICRKTILETEEDGLRGD